MNNNDLILREKPQANDDPILMGKFLIIRGLLQGFEDKKQACLDLQGRAKPGTDESLAAIAGIFHNIKSYLATGVLENVTELDNNMQDSVAAVNDSIATFKKTMQSIFQGDYNALQKMVALERVKQYLEKSMQGLDSLGSAEITIPQIPFKAALTEEEIAVLLGNPLPAPYIVQDVPPTERAENIIPDSVDKNAVAIFASYEKNPVSLDQKEIKMLLNKEIDMEIDLENLKTQMNAKAQVLESILSSFGGAYGSIDAENNLCAPLAKAAKIVGRWIQEDCSQFWNDEVPPHLSTNKVAPETARRNNKRDRQALDSFKQAADELMRNLNDDNFKKFEKALDDVSMAKGGRRTKNHHLPSGMGKKLWEETEMNGLLNAFPVACVLALSDGEPTVRPAEKPAAPSPYSGTPWWHLQNPDNSK